MSGVKNFDAVPEQRLATGLLFEGELLLLFKTATVAILTPTCSGV